MFVGILCTFMRLWWHSKYLCIFVYYYVCFEKEGDRGQRRNEWMKKTFCWKYEHERMRIKCANRHYSRRNAFYRHEWSRQMRERASERCSFDSVHKFIYVTSIIITSRHSEDNMKETNGLPMLRHVRCALRFKRRIYLMPCAASVVVQAPVPRVRINMPAVPLLTWHYFFLRFFVLFRFFCQAFNLIVCRRWPLLRQCAVRI